MEIISRAWGRVASVLAAALLVSAFAQDIWPVLKEIAMSPDPLLLTLATIAAVVAGWLSLKARLNRRAVTLEVVKRLALELPRYPTPEAAAEFIAAQLRRIGVSAEVPPPGWYLGRESLADPRSNPGSHLDEHPT